MCTFKKWRLLANCVSISPKILSHIISTKGCIHILIHQYYIIVVNFLWCWDILLIKSKFQLQNHRYLLFLVKDHWHVDLHTLPIRIFIVHCSYYDVCKTQKKIWSGKNCCKISKSTEYFDCNSKRAITCVMSDCFI
jgi:hypothetical protein